VILAVRLDARVAVGGTHHFVGHHLHLFADFVELAAHESLDREDGVLRVGDGLTLGNLADETLAALGERDDRRRQAAPFGVGDDDRLAPFDHGDDRVGSSEIDSDDFAHGHIMKSEYLAVNFTAQNFHYAVLY